MLALVPAFRILCVLPYPCLQTLHSANVRHLDDFLAILYSFGSPLLLAKHKFEKAC